MEFAQQQLRCAFDEIDYAVANESPESRAQREKNGWGPLTNPRNTEPDGTLHLVPSKDWTSGFFPGELWFLYEYTQNNFWKKKAQQHTDILEQEKMNGGTHDMGFKMYCSFESGCGVQAVRPAPSNKAAMGSFNFMVTVDNFNFIYVYYLLALFNVFAISKLLRYRDYCHAYSFSSRTAIGVMYWLPWYCFPFRLHSKLPFGSFTFPRRRLLVPFCSG